MMRNATMSQQRKHPADPHAIGASLRHAHKTLCRHLDQLVSASDDDFAPAFPSLVAEVEVVFRHEEGAMEIFGYAQLHEHRAENAVILAALHRVLVQVEVGDCGLGRQVLSALRDVLAVHRLNTDLALASAPPPSHARLHGKAARATLHVTANRRHH
jgi:hemerythrin